MVAALQPMLLASTASPKEISMDVLELIKIDHRRISDLFVDIKGESGRQQRLLLFQNIRHDLELHTYAEENVFYPAFRNYPAFQGLLKEFYSDHADVKKMLKEISEMGVDTVEFENKIVELINHVEAHVAEEEGEFFSLVKQEMKRREREQIGRLFELVKHEREEAA
jgi:hemerythrin superfamily protein